MSDVTPPSTALLDASIRVPDHVVFRSVGDRTVLLNIRTCRYHGLNPTGGRMLEVLSETGQIEPAVTRIAEEFGVDSTRVQTDLLALCERLRAHGLIEVQP